MRRPPALCRWPARRSAASPRRQPYRSSGERNSGAGRFGTCSMLRMPRAQVARRPRPPTRGGGPVIRGDAVSQLADADIWFGCFASRRPTLVRTASMSPRHCGNVHSKSATPRTAEAGAGAEGFPAATYSPGSLRSEYPWRWRLSLPCSGWERVGHLRYGHRKGLSAYEGAHNCKQGQVLDRLVPVSSVPCGMYTSGLSTW